MPDERKDEDIREVMAEEKRRGKRPHDPGAKKQRSERLGLSRDLLTISRENDFVEAIRRLGCDDPKKIEDALKVWRSFSSSRKR
jgi:hypothetical protein